jgi:uncharacterized phage protein (TIGR01671 family)
MENIKLRAWDINNKVMLDWFTLTQSVWNKDLSNLLYSVMVLLNPHYKLMLYTGREDKNGFEIYAGDIIKNPLAEEPEEKGFIVKWDNKHCAFMCFNVNYPDDYYYAFGFENIAGFEAIGNIYDNPELLTIQ